MGHPIPHILQHSMTRQNQPTPIELEIAHDINSVEAKAWNALVDPNDPFTEHAFLASLERSGSASRETGWFPVHLLAKQGTDLVGAGRAGCV